MRRLLCHDSPRLRLFRALAELPPRAYRLGALLRPRLVPKCRAGPRLRAPAALAEDRAENGGGSLAELRVDSSRYKSFNKELTCMENVEQGVDRFVGLSTLDHEHGRLEEGHIGDVSFF